MGYLQLLRHVYKLNVETTQILQDNLLTSPSQIILFYEDHAQLWNLDVQKKIKTSFTSESIYFWSVPTAITNNSFAFVSLENCEPTLGTYDFTQNKVVKVCDLPKEQENYTKLFYFEATKEILIDARGKDHRLLIWNGKDIIEQKVDENSVVEKYNNNAISIFSSQNRATGFEIQTGIKDIKKYAIAGVDEGTIIAVQEYSPNEAIIAVLHGGKTSTVLLYALNTGQVVKREKVDFPIDNLIKVSDFWIAMCTVEQEEKSQVQVQACFGEGSNKIVKLPIKRWIRYWNEFLPIVTLDHDQENQKQRVCGIELVRCAEKKSVYIKLMESMGIIKDFGEEIIKATINNF